MQTNFRTPTLQLSPSEAAQHLLNRRRARVSAVDYAAYIDVPDRPLSDDPDTELFAPIETNLRQHDKILLTALEETSQTPGGRLMVFMPRGSAKSTYSSIVYPSKYLGSGQSKKLILASYGDDLPKKHGRKTRSIIRQNRYRQLFDAELSTESQAADYFVLSNGSEYLATGMGAAVVGHRAHGIIIDDPVKNIADARSETKRNSTWDSYNYDLLPCLIPGGWVVLVMTRWDEDDIAGRILPEDWKGDSGVFKGRDGSDWRVLCLQARCATHTDPLGRNLGEYLAPEWFPRSHWLKFEADKMLWASMCQQIPRPLEGSYFTESSLLVDGQPIAVPHRADFVFAIIDSAMKSGLQHDGTAVTFFARSFHGQSVPLVVLDWDTKQIDAALLIEWLPWVYERLEELARECDCIYGVRGVWIEDKQSGTVLLQQAINAGLPAEPIDTKLTAMGKSERAFDASPYVTAGDVKITEYAYQKTVEYKGSRKNHFLSQVCGFSMDSKDKDPKDLLDTFTYGVILSLGNAEGF